MNDAFGHPALISDDVEEVMLGADWLKENRCVWDFGTGDLSINGCPAVTLTQKGYNKCRRVMVQEPIEIPPRSQMHDRLVHKETQ